MSDVSSNAQAGGEPAASKLRTISWGPIAAVFWALIIYLFPQIIVGMLLSIYPVLRHWGSARANAWLNSSITAQFIYTVLVETIAVNMVWRLLLHYKASFAAIGLTWARLRDVSYALVGFGAYFALYLAGVGILTKLIPSLNINQQQNVGFQNATAAVPLVLTFISLVVLPPLAEETIFRGFVFTGFRRKFGFVLAALGTSALFAIPHLFESQAGGLLWIAGVDTFILSLTLCYLREKTGRLWAGMAVHALKNGLAFATLFIFHAH